MGIVGRALIIVGKNFVGLFRGLEADFCLCTIFFGGLVRMVR